MVKYNERYSLELWKYDGKIKVVIHSNFLGGTSKLNANSYSTLEGAIAALEGEGEFQK